MTLRLDALQPADLPTLTTWRNLPEVRAHVREVRYLSLADTERWYTARDGVTWLSMAVREDQYYVQASREELLWDAPIRGVVALGNISWPHRHAEVSVLCVPSSHEPEALRLLTDYAFGHLGLHRLEAETLTAVRARLFEVHAGWLDEGIRWQAYWRDGKWIDARRWYKLSPY